MLVTLTEIPVKWFNENKVNALHETLMSLAAKCQLLWSD